MASYYVNNGTDSNNDHEVHKEPCDKMPSDRKYLGEFDNCQDAVKEAKKTYTKVNGCYYCSRACHTS
ncbi:MAG TPA: hypothetical protein VFN10_18490 [Thermoanaerobaculia bacterium]|nr:hypothetical protein [Thermoanaerobaculia bacterium]